MTDPIDTAQKKKIATWLITVAGYGEFIFEGSEKEAEEMRAHKSNWEQGVGRKIRISREEALQKEPDTKYWSRP